MEEQEISVPLEESDDAGSTTTIRYVIRGLASEQEIQPWAEFCASVFAYKASPPPPDYFERHFCNDPRREASLIRVAVTADNAREIVSSCRIFRKAISIGNGKTVEAGGIGEVCTSSNHRKRGLSKLLLQNAIEIMTARKMQVSLLHAAPSFFPVYQKAGNYQCTSTEWTVCKMETKLLLESARLPSSCRRETSIRLANFPDDTRQLQALHKAYSEDRFCGCIIRSEQYWNEYISKELEGSLWVLLDAYKILGWIAVRPRCGGRYQLRDFGCDRNELQTGDALLWLLGKATEKVVEDLFELVLPTIVWNEMKQENSKFCQLVDGEVSTENDLGWMYKALQDDAPSMVEISSSTPHLIWPADSF
jgi:hypothetical protein